MSAIELSREQAMLLEIAAKFFRERWPIESVREQLGAERSDDEALWQEMAELGWMGTLVPEEHGGMGLGATELVALVEPMGRSLFASPFADTQLAVQALLAGGAPAQQATWLPRLAAGARASVALIEENGSWELEACRCAAEPAAGGMALSGAKSFVLDAPSAELIVASVRCEGAPALVLLAAEALGGDAAELETVIDETQRSYHLTLDGAVVPEEALMRGDAARRALCAIERTGLLLQAAAACGGAAGVLALTVEYLKTRKQFGRLIGGFQGLKHPTVEVLCELERARSLLYWAATHFDSDEGETAVRMAKAQAEEAFLFAADRAVQFHGAFGFTYECDAQLFLRRALWCRAQLGDALHQRQRLAELVL